MVKVIWSKVAKKKEEIFIDASVLVIFDALPLLVALLVPAFVAGVGVFCAGDLPSWTWRCICSMLAALGLLLRCRRATDAMRVAPLSFEGQYVVLWNYWNMHRGSVFGTYHEVGRVMILLDLVLYFDVNWICRRVYTISGVCLGFAKEVCDVISIGIAVDGRREGERDVTDLAHVSTDWINPQIPLNTLKGAQKRLQVVALLQPRSSCGCL